MPRSLGMSVAVAIDELREKIAEFGTDPHLITVGPTGAAHVVSVRVLIDGERWRVSAGRTTSANIASNPGVTLLWSDVRHGAYSLIVDGTAATSDEDAAEVTITPTRAVLHRLAGASSDLPSCVPLEQPN